MYFVSHFGHAKVYETSVWTPCFQNLAKTMGTGVEYRYPHGTAVPVWTPSADEHFPFKYFYQICYWLKDFAKIIRLFWLL